jgi:glycosyltransferase involved in cell wall biosynthesis
LFYFAEAGILADEMRRRSIRHVHAHFANVASEVGMLAARLLDTQWSLSLHGLADFGNPTAARLTQKIGNASLVRCVSDFGRAQAMLHAAPQHWRKIHVVRCGIDVHRFSPQPPDRESQPAQCLRILTVGRLAPEKGHHLLLHAIQRARQAGLDCTCCIVGDGPMMHDLEDSIRRLGLDDRVRLAGAVGQEQIGLYYADADVLVLPSLAEGLPVVLMEAMASGLPIVASRVMGIPELVEDGVTGLLVPPGRVQPIADAIARLAQDGALRERMAEHGCERVRQLHDIRLTSRRLADLFAGLAPLADATDRFQASPTEAGTATT